MRALLLAGPIAEVASAIATLMLMAGGFLMMLQKKRWAARLLCSGVALAAAASLLLTTSPAEEQVFAPWQAVLALGAIPAATFRRWRVAGLLVTPLIVSLAFPSDTGIVPFVALVAATLLFGLVAIARGIGLILGKEGMGQVTGTYAVRLIDHVFAKRTQRRQRASGKGTFLVHVDREMG